MVELAALQIVLVILVTNLALLRMLIANLPAETP